MTAGIPNSRNTRLRSTRIWVGRVLLSLAVLAVVTVSALYVGLQALGYRFYEVRSESMTPALGQGDVIAVKREPGRKTTHGEIIAFETQAGLVVMHRVQSISSHPDLRSVYKDRNGNVVKETMRWSPRTFYTKGDANPEPDPFSVPESRVIGTKAFSVPAPFALLVTSVGRETLFFLGIACVVLFIAWEVIESVWKRLRRDIATESASRGLPR